ncbi:MAG: DUF1572 family protein [Bacteroidota bacterium]|nr:DUF1572 family protein [Bacteroidota bacterium]
MTKSEITDIYQRNIKRLHAEINSYNSDAALWEERGAISNSGGNLILHLIGNLNHFIGATLGKTAYVRNREAEFNTKDLSKQHLIELLEEANKQVNHTMNSLPEFEMQDEYPYDFAGKHSTEYYLVFFIAHFEYHLGQINYHRRICSI